MAETFNLELLFKDGKDRNQKIVITKPKKDLDRTTAENAMNEIVNSDLFKRADLDLHASVAGAQYVKKTVEEIFTNK